jgi:hypothetical protein
MRLVPCVLGWFGAISIMFVPVAGRFLSSDVSSAPFPLFSSWYKVGAFLAGVSLVPFRRYSFQYEVGAFCLVVVRCHILTVRPCIRSVPILRG